MVHTSHFLVIDCKQSLNGHRHTYKHIRTKTHTLTAHTYTHRHTLYTQTHTHTHSYTQWSCSCGLCDNETILGETHLDCVISSPWKQSSALKLECLVPVSCSMMSSNIIPTIKEKNRYLMTSECAKNSGFLKYGDFCGAD